MNLLTRWFENRRKQVAVIDERQGMSRKCSDCQTPIYAVNKTGRCRPCLTRASAPPEYHCVDCTTKLRRKTETGRCGPCSRQAVNAVRAARKAARLTCSDCPAPIHYGAERCRSCSQRHRRGTTSKLEVVRMCSDCAGPISAASKGRCASCARKAQTSDWLPDERRGDYLALRTLYGAHKAKLMVLDDIARERLRASGEARETNADRARLAAMSPFERQDELLRRGAGLVERVAYRTPEPVFSLTGSSMGSMS